jgi:hypothetical protein
VKYVDRLSSTVFLIGVVALFMALFIGHLVTVKSFPSAPAGAGTSGTSIGESDWRAIRAQYDPTYMERIQAVTTDVSSKGGSDWRATREQYQPGYMTEINKTPAKTKKASSGCGGGAHY